MDKIIRYNLLTILVVFVTFSGFQSCKISYSFTGANLPADVKTFSVAFFPNRAKLIYPDLSQSLTEGLREKLRRQTSLNEKDEAGDLEFSGYISNYEIRPTAIQKKDLAAQNRLTITINVKYTNNKNHDLDFERSFSGYEDYDTIKSLDEVEGELVNIIIEKLTEDIFNATIADW